MLFQSPLYCSNSCTSLHFNPLNAKLNPICHLLALLGAHHILHVSRVRVKILNSHTKTFKIHPYMSQSPFKPSSGGLWMYFARLLNWNVDLCVRYKQCRYVAVCHFILSLCVCVCVCVCGFHEIVSTGKLLPMDKSGYKRLKFVYSNIHPTRCNVTQFTYKWKLLFLFQVVPPPIIRSVYNCNYSI
jgi:hypothetical protein